QLKPMATVAKLIQRHLPNMLTYLRHQVGVEDGARVSQRRALQGGYVLPLRRPRSLPTRNPVEPKTYSEVDPIQSVRTDPKPPNRRTELNRGSEHSYAARQSKRGQSGSGAYSLGSREQPHEPSTNLIFARTSWRAAPLKSLMLRATTISEEFGTPLARYRIIPSPK